MAQAESCGPSQSGVGASLQQPCLAEREVANRTEFRGHTRRTRATGLNESAVQLMICHPCACVCHPPRIESRVHKQGRRRYLRTAAESNLGTFVLVIALPTRDEVGQCITPSAVIHRG